jgi:hypothetical protein
MGYLWGQSFSQRDRLVVGQVACVPGAQGGEGLLVAAALATRAWALSAARSATFEWVLV